MKRQPYANYIGGYKLIEHAVVSKNTNFPKCRPAGRDQQIDYRKHGSGNRREFFFFTRRRVYVPYKKYNGV